MQKLQKVAFGIRFASRGAKSGGQPLAMEAGLNVVASGEEEAIRPGPENQSRIPARGWMAGSHVEGRLRLEWTALGVTRGKTGGIVREFGLLS